MPLVGRLNFPGHSLTMIVKATFELGENGEVVPAEEQLFPTGDEYYADDEDGTGAPRYESDFAYFKPHTDLLLVGSCHTPNQQPMTACPVRFQVGDRSRILVVTGDRYRRSLIPGLGHTPPAPFTTMPIRYENSYGGPGFADNPVGKGRRKMRLDNGHRRVVLPNISDPSQTASFFRPLREPAGFGPFRRSWPLRAGKLGNYKRGYLKERWPWFATDMDWSYFNAAPPEMQMPGYLHGNETITLENLDPRHAYISTQLPGTRMRCFLEIQPAGNSSLEFREVHLNADTLWVDTDNARLVMVWRGWTEITTADFEEEVRQIYLVKESVDDAAQDLAYWQAQFMRDQIEEPVEEVPDTDPGVLDEDPESKTEIAQIMASAQAQEREQLIDAGLDPDNLPEQTPEEKQFEASVLAAYGLSASDEEELTLTREKVIAMHREGLSLSGKDLAGLDLSGLDLRGADFESAILIDAMLNNSTLSGANLKHSNFSGARLDAAILDAADLSDADFSGAEMAGVNLSGATLESTSFDKAVMTGACLDQSHGADTLFTFVDLNGASFQRCRLEGADFSESQLASVDFQEAELHEVSFSGAHAPDINMTNAKIIAARMVEGANFTNANFQNVVADESIWEKSILNGVDFRYSRMDGADFTGADLCGVNASFADWPGCNLSKANLENAIFLRMNLFMGSLEGANLPGSDFRGSNLYGVEFHNARIQETLFEGGNLKMTKLAQ